MAKSFAKNKHNRKLRGGKKRNGNNRVSKETIEAAIRVALDECGQEIFDYAKQCYEEHGRGCINVTVKDHPMNPYKRGNYYYITEEENNVIQSEIPFLTANDELIAEYISTYDPLRQVVICVWHGTMYMVTVGTDVCAGFTVSLNATALTVH